MTADSRYEELHRRMDAAAAWCSGRVDRGNLEGCLRAAGLRPPEASCGGVLVAAATVEEVAARRAAALRSAGRAAGATHGGRLLVFDPGQSLSDGAAAAETEGLFDDDNVPPWDTWLVFVEETPRVAGQWSELDSYLVCWIPEELIELTERAIWVNPEECLHWAEDVSTGFLDAMRA
jgi:hypothetical protein